MMGWWLGLVFWYNEYSRSVDCVSWVWHILLRRCDEIVNIWCILYGWCKLDFSWSARSFLGLLGDMGLFILIPIVAVFMS